MRKVARLHEEGAPLHTRHRPLDCPFPPPTRMLALTAQPPPTHPLPSLAPPSPPALPHRRPRSSPRSAPPPAGCATPCAPTCTTTATTGTRRARARRTRGTCTSTAPSRAACASPCARTRRAAARLTPRLDTSTRTQPPHTASPLLLCRAPRRFPRPHLPRSPTTRLALAAPSARERTRTSLPLQENDCPGWSSMEECSKNAGHMLLKCPNSCSVCEARGASAREEGTSPPFTPPHLVSRTAAPARTSTPLRAPSG